METSLIYSVKPDKILVPKLVRNTRIQANILNKIPENKIYKHSEMILEHKIDLAYQK